MARWRRLVRGLARGLVLAVLGVLLVLVAAIALLQTPWAHNQLRGLIVRQANNYLTATLDIGRLSGSLFRGVELDNVRLSREGEALVEIERVAVSYSIRELVDRGTVVRSLTLTRPRIVAAKEPDGRWNLANLVKPRPSQTQPSGRRRPIRIERIDISDGNVTFRDPLTFGAAHVPTVFTHLNTRFSFSSETGLWRLDFDRAAFVGAAPELTVRSLTGAVGSGDAGWLFRALHVVTPRSEFTIDGGTDRSKEPAPLDLQVDARRFAFQEWAGVLGGLRNIAIESAFTARLNGPPSAMATTIALKSDGGDVRGDLVLDTTIPGWHAKGNASVQRLDLARWLNRPDRPSDISGDVNLDIDLQLGGHFPKGPFTFKGSHAAYLEYEADDVVARGTLTDTDVRIASATATAYGANVRLTASTMGIDAPYAFHFVGTALGVDLRQVPKNVPVPHVESALAFDYDVTGQFADRGFIRGGATFADSEFLGARVSAGATGLIDTGVVPFHYGGEGDISNVDLNHFGDRLQIAWLSDPRYDGTVRGRFHVDGTGSDAATMTMTGGGRLDDAELFHGRLSSATVGVTIGRGSLEGSYDGELTRIDPSIPMADPLYRATLTGHAAGHIAVRDLLLRSPELSDYSLEATLTARDTEVRGIEVSTGSVEASMSNGTLHIARLVASGPAVDVEAEGALELDGVRSSALDYHVTRSDLSQLADLLGRDIHGQAVTTGRITGPIGRMRFAGAGTVDRLAASGVEATSTTAAYDVTIPGDDPRAATGTVDLRSSFLSVSGQPLQSLDGRLTYDAGHVTTKLDGVVRSGVTASLDGTFDVDLDRRVVAVSALAFTMQRTSWRLAQTAQPRIAWTDAGVVITGLDVVDAGTGQQHLAAAGAWNSTGGSELRVVATRVPLESLMLDEASAARYSGVLDLTATITGSADHPVVSGDFSISQGRIRRLTYQTFGGHVEFKDNIFNVDVRLDQAPGVWLTGAGSVPMSAFDRTRPPGALRLAVKSSDVSLTLLEGVTDVVRNVGGQMRLDVVVLGTSQDPHFSGRVDLTGASFDVASSGARYRNGRLAVQLSTDRLAIEALHVEDESGHPLDVTGSLGTHELRVGDLQVQVNARQFDVLHNEYGRVNVDARLNLSGQFESPKLTGALTITGGSLNVDRILDRALFQPYSTQAAAGPAEIDPIVALNPWDRMGIDLELHIPGTLRMVGENVQVSPGTPLGLGDINLRAFGDLSLYKDPAQPMYVNGSLDSLSGTYAFQGRRFDLDPSSSIGFRGDLNPELYITVNRIISGVETRVSITGPMREPELRLASTPPLDQSDILSLIVFNTSLNELSAIQQQELAVRAGTLAAGFIAAPMMSALQKTLGIDTLEVEPGADIRGGPRVTVGNEIAPGLVARFSRQFGEADYDEATIEYQLSRIFRIRATFSDAGTLTAISPFRRVERAGIDLLLFFSF